MRINTLDLDEISKEELNIIINKIAKCPYSKTTPLFYFLRDTAKGYHLKYECRKNCDNCRFVFDDAKRYYIDRCMPLKLRDFLFDGKTPLGCLPITEENLNKLREMEI